MIKDFNIENFKGFEKLSIENLARVNLFGGKNNVGKTSLLESIFTFHDRYNPDLLIKQLAWRGAFLVALKEETQHELWLSAFHNFDLKKKIQLTSIDSENGTEKVEIDIDENFVVPISSGELSNYNKGINSSTTQIRSKYALHIKTIVKSKIQQDCHVYFLNNNIQMYVKFLDGRK